MFDFFYDTSKNQARKRQSAKTKNDRSKWTAENWDSSTPTQNRNRVTRDGDEHLHHLEEAVMTDEEGAVMMIEEVVMTEDKLNTAEVTTDGNSIFFLS